MTKTVNTVRWFDSWHPHLYEEIRNSSVTKTVNAVRWFDSWHLHLYEEIRNSSVTKTVNAVRRFDSWHPHLYEEIRNSSVTKTVNAVRRFDSCHLHLYEEVRNSSVKQCRRYQDCGIVVFCIHYRGHVEKLHQCLNYLPLLPSQTLSSPLIIGTALCLILCPDFSSQYNDLSVLPQWPLISQD